MKGIVADANIQGHVDLLVTLMRAEPWKIFWDELHLTYVDFGDIGLTGGSLDSEIWETCQKEELVLVTDNRNNDDPNSLESMIQTKNTPNSLPVVTIASIPQLRNSREYANRVIERLLDFLERMDSLRGAGRLYVP